MRKLAVVRILLPIFFVALFLFDKYRSEHFFIEASGALTNKSCIIFFYFLIF
jgi:hypothetical protein